MSLNIGWPASFLTLSGLRLAKMKMDAPFSVAETSLAWKARLLLVSSQASAPSSHASFPKLTIHFTASTVPFELMTTFLPLWSTSAPPNDHTNGEVQVGAARNEGPGGGRAGLA